MKSKGKCQQEDGEDGGHGQEGETDVVEEDDVLAHPRVEPDVEEEVEPLLLLLLLLLPDVEEEVEPLLLLLLLLLLPDVEEKVEPGQGDRHRAGLPLYTRSQSCPTIQPAWVADRDVEGEKVDDQVEDEDQGKTFEDRQRLLPRHFPQLRPDGGELAVDEEKEDQPQGEEKQDQDSKSIVPHPARL